MKEKKNICYRRVLDESGAGNMESRVSANANVSEKWEGYSF